METVPTAPTRKLDYLVVEDAPDVCEGIIRRMASFPQWRALGYTLSVSAALDMIRTHRPALLFLDWELAGGNAYAILEAVQNMPGYHPYTVFFTGYQSDEPQIPERIINDYGVDKYLVKPIWEKLRAQLPEYLAAAKKKAAGDDPPPAGKVVWLTDTNGVKHRLNLLELRCVVQHPTEQRCRDFYFATRDAPYCIRMKWEDAAMLLAAHSVDYFRTNSKYSLVARDFIERYERPFVWLRGTGTARKLEVVPEKHTAFERWLMADDAAQPR